MCSKPDKRPFIKFLEISRCLPETCVSIGDRYEIDLESPLELGMGGILVDGVEDVYALPGKLPEISPFGLIESSVFPAIGS